MTGEGPIKTARFEALSQQEVERIHAASMQVLETAGIIVRFSVGLEKVEDLLADLDQALRGRTFKGLVGPLAYRLTKQSTCPAGAPSSMKRDSVRLRTSAFRHIAQRDGHMRPVF